MTYEERVEERMNRRNVILRQLDENMPTSEFVLASLALAELFDLLDSVHAIAEGRVRSTAPDRPVHASAEERLRSTAPDRPAHDVMTSRSFPRFNLDVPMPPGVKPPRGSPAAG